MKWKTGVASLCLVLGALSLASVQRGKNSPDIELYHGYITRVECAGNLKLSSIGNPALVTLQALPDHYACGLLLKPLMEQGRTNLLIETSSGTFNRIVEIAPRRTPMLEDLTVRIGPLLEEGKK